LKSVILLHHGLLLLALHDEKGTVKTSYLQYGLAACLLAELILQERIDLEGKKKKVFVKSTEPCDDEVLTEVLQTIAASKREKPLKDWVTKFAGLKNLKHRVAAPLVNDGVLELKIKKILWVFEQRLYPLTRTEVEAILIAEAKAAVIQEPEQVEARTALLIAIAKGTRVLDAIFTKEELKTHKEQLERIFKGQVLGEVTKEVIAAIEVAVLVAVIIPAAVVTTG